MCDCWGKNNMHCRPQTAGGMTPSPRGNLRAFCSMFCLLSLFFSFSFPCTFCVRSSLPPTFSVAIIVFFLTALFPVDFLPSPFQARFSGSCSLPMSPNPEHVQPLTPSLHWPFISSHPAHLSWLPSLFSFQLSCSHLSTLFIFHIKQSFPWSQLCKQ